MFSCSGLELRPRIALDADKYFEREGRLLVAVLRSHTGLLLATLAPLDLVVGQGAFVEQIFN